MEIAGREQWPRQMHRQQGEYRKQAEQGNTQRRTMTTDRQERGISRGHAHTARAQSAMVDGQ